MYRNRALKFVLLAILSICTDRSLLAQNLVPNGGFEQMNLCPPTYSYIHAATGWSQPTAGTSDFFHRCAPIPGGANAPHGISGYQQPHSGDGMGGFMTYLAAYNYREYIQIALSSPLVAGVTYQLEAYVSLGDISSHAVNNIGFYASVFPPNNSSSWQPLHITPQIGYPGSVYLTDTVNWMPVCGTFIAAGGEQYLTIGNFQNASTVAPIPVGPPSSYAYYYIDDIHLEIASGSPCFILDVENSIELHLASESNGNVLEWNLPREARSGEYEILHGEHPDDLNSIHLISGTGLGDQLKWRHSASRTGESWYQIRFTGPNSEQLHSNLVNSRSQSSGWDIEHINIEEERMEITLTTIPDSEIHAELWDAQGQLLATQTSPDANAHLYFSIPSLADGLYFLRINSTNSPEWRIEKFLR